MEAIQKAGLAGRVRLGVPLPQTTETPAPSSSTGSRTTHGAEEAFPPDELLRPLSRPAKGRLIEIAGAISSGRTALAYRAAAGTTARGELVGWVDVPHALDPRSMLRAGVDLRSVLWVRPPQIRAALRSTELLIKTGFALVTLDLEGARARELSRLGPPIWTRLLRAVNAARSTVLVLASERLAGSFATLGMELERTQAHFDSGLLEGMDGHLRVVRHRDAPADQHCNFQIHHRPQPAA
jgi:hypothetical protein